MYQNKVQFSYPMIFFIQLLIPPGPPISTTKTCKAYHITPFWKQFG